MTQPESQPAPKPTNRRRAARRAPKRTTKLTCQKGAMGLGPNIALGLLDLSETGARLLVKDELRQGQEVELNFQGSSHRKPVKILAVVVWCVETAEKSHCIGTLFRKNLSYADLQQLA